MRPIAILALAAAFAGCRGTPPGPQPEDTGRDYLSANRSSIAFLFETRRNSVERRRENLRATLELGSRRAFRRDQMREGRRFARHAMFDGIWSEAVTMWRGVKREVAVGDFWRSVRFGLLDSGE